MKLSSWSLLVSASLCDAFILPSPQDVLNSLSPKLPSASGADQSPLGGAERFLVEISPTETRWVTEEEKWELRRGGIRFFDITEHQSSISQLGVPDTLATVTYPDAPEHTKTVSKLIKSLDKTQMRENLGNFTSFFTRYYKSDTGRQSSEWLLQLVNETLTEANVGSVKPFAHSWAQSSVIATIPGRSNKTVVIGAHQDSVNLWWPYARAPGADDDGSGTVTILEALRVLVQDKAIAKGKAENTVEFHWYSAEEGGLLGSQAIFNSYRDEGRDVKAMLQQDMTGYKQGMLDAGKPESVGVIVDFVNPGLTAFIKKIVDTYCTIHWVETKCGYACSDHASASKAGYPSAFVIESEFKDSDKLIHTSSDTLDVLSFDHMLQHARLTLGFVYELAFAKFD